MDTCKHLTKHRHEISYYDGLEMLGRLSMSHSKTVWKKMTNSYNFFFNIESEISLPAHSGFCYTFRSSSDVMSPLGWSWIILPLVEARPDGNFRSLSLQHFFYRFVIRHFNFISSDFPNSHPTLGFCIFGVVIGFSRFPLSVVLILRFKQALNYNSCEPSWKKAGNSKWIPVYKIGYALYASVSIICEWLYSQNIFITSLDFLHYNERDK